MKLVDRVLVHTFNCGSPLSISPCFSFQSKHRSSINHVYAHTHTHRYMYARANKWICSFFLFLFLIRIYKDGRSGKWLSQSVCHSSGNKQCVQSIPSCALYAVVVLLSLLFLFPSLERRVPRNGNCLIRGRRVPLSRSGSL